MSAWVKSLENVTFHNKLGTQAELIERIAVLARELAPKVGADADLAEQAARLAKADLSSEMVYEFPELQGLMGRYYAEAAGKSPCGCGGSGRSITRHWGRRMMCRQRRCLSPWRWPTSWTS